MQEDVARALAHLAEVSAGIRHAQDYKDRQKLSAISQYRPMRSFRAVRC
jgi:hypothetical protein